jgi:arginyl-tRNA synthetase
LTGKDFSGESDYNDRLRAVVDELGRLGLLRDSDGAQCVFPAGFTGREGEPLPLIVRKRDGGYGYPATDLAAIRYRLQELNATRLLYVVGLPQRQHFEMVFAVARLAGWFGPSSTATFVGFGSILGPDGKMLRSRAGDSVKLVGLLDEAVARAAEVSGPDVARAVGIGAVKYADLSNDRAKDYVFDWDRMLALVGDTSVYLQYAHARVRSIFAKADSVEPGEPKEQAIQPHEHTLAVELLGFPAVVEYVAGSLEFHRLAAYLYAVATAFSRFFEHCPVLQSGGAVRERRLRLCDMTARTLHRGLWLLGIEAPAPM